MRKFLQLVLSFVRRKRGRALSDYNKSLEGSGNKRKDIQAITMSNVHDVEQMKYILESCHKNDIHLETIGLQKVWKFVDRIYRMRDFLEKNTENEILIFTDAYDVFYRDDLDTIKAKFISMDVDIVWSCEKLYSHQIGLDKKFYDNLAGTSQYKYLNAGGAIGYRDKLLEFYSSIIESLDTEDFNASLCNREGSNPHTAFDLTEDDQAIISHFITLNYEEFGVALDYDCKIFYVPTSDWSDINICKANLGKFDSSVVHVPYKRKYQYILDALFYDEYNF